MESLFDIPPEGGQDNTEFPGLSYLLGTTFEDEYYVSDQPAAPGGGSSSFSGDPLTMDQDVFRGLGSLQSLLLIRTGLGVIPEKLFNGLGQIAYLEVNEEYVKELPGIVDTYFLSFLKI